MVTSKGKTWKCKVLLFKKKRKRKRLELNGRSSWRLCSVIASYICQPALAVRKRWLCRVCPMGIRGRKCTSKQVAWNRRAHEDGKSPCRLQHRADRNVKCCWEYSDPRKCGRRVGSRWYHQPWLFCYQRILSGWRRSSSSSRPSWRGFSLESVNGRD